MVVAASKQERLAIGLEADLGEYPLPDRRAIWRLIALVSHVEPHGHIGRQGDVAAGLARSLDDRDRPAYGGFIRNLTFLGVPANDGCLPQPVAFTNAARR